MKSILMTLAVLASIILLASCSGLTSPVGLASARQQTKNVSVTIKIEGVQPQPGTPLITWTEGAMSYDGTRGDIAKNKAGGAIQDDDTVTLSLPQASPGATVAKSVWDRIVARAKSDKTETVPAIFGAMSLEKWKELKASYIECPECLSLNDAERAALKAATGK